MARDVVAELRPDEAPVQAVERQHRLHARPLQLKRRARADERRELGDDRLALRVDALRHGLAHQRHRGVGRDALEQSVHAPQVGGALAPRDQQLADARLGVENDGRGVGAQELLHDGLPHLDEGFGPQQRGRAPLLERRELIGPPHEGHGAVRARQVRGGVPAARGAQRLEVGLLEVPPVHRRPAPLVRRRGGAHLGEDARGGLQLAEVDVRGGARAEGVHLLQDGAEQLAPHVGVHGRVEAPRVQLCDAGLGRPLRDVVAEVVEHDAAELRVQFELRIRARHELEQRLAVARIGDRQHRRRHAPTQRRVDPPPEFVVERLGHRVGLGGGGVRERVPRHAAAGVVRRHRRLLARDDVVHVVQRADDPAPRRVKERVVLRRAELLRHRVRESRTQVAGRMQSK